MQFLVMWVMNLEADATSRGRRSAIFWSMVRTPDLLELIDRLVAAREDDRTFTVSPAESRAVTDEIENLRRALESRTEIGQAQGILMERHRVDADGAFALLVRLSQHLNRKLSDVCAELVATRELPPDPLDD